MQKVPDLVLISGEQAGRRLTVSSAGLRIGRSSQNDVALPDGEMSRSHCLFELKDGRLSVTDLASANGTMVNGEDIGAETRLLCPGDVIEAGTTQFRVESDEPCEVVRPAAALPAEVDLGLTVAEEGEASAGPDRVNGKRRLIVNLLWTLTAFLLVGAAVLVLALPRTAEKPQPVRPASQAAGVTSLAFEKIDADSARVFSYRLRLDAEGTLDVGIDDMPAANRHVAKRAKLKPEALRRVNEMFSDLAFFKLDDAFQGPSAQDENALSFRRIRVVMSDGRVKDVQVENVLEPDVFRTMREKLEAFSMNELGIRAIQYSREQLQELSRESARVGAAKWDERDVEYGNLSASVKAYREAVFYLETVNPKPEGYAQLKERLAQSEMELAKRYKEQRFVAERAINLEDWATAQVELRKLCDMVPEKGDDRHAEANAKLLDVESRMKQQKKKGGKGK